MSYSQEQVVAMLDGVSKNFTDLRGKVENRFDSYDKELEEVKNQGNAIEKAVALGQFPGGGFGNAHKVVYASLGDQLKDVAAVSRPGGDSAAASRLMKVQASLGTNEGTPSDGGFLIQPDFSVDLIRKQVQTSVLEPRCLTMTLGANSNGINIPLVDETSRASGSRWGGIQSYWVTESGTFTPSKPKFRMDQVMLKKLIGLCYASDELLQDSTVLAQVISSGFASELAFRTDDAIINGVGGGQPLGIMNSPALVTVPKESGQTAKTILYENICNMWARLSAGSEANAVWLCNKDILPQLFTMSIAVGTGGVPVFTPANTAANQPFMTLFGKPIICVEQCATLGTVGDILLVDLSQYLWISKGVQEASSIHVAFLTGESCFRFVKRCDGQTLWRAPLTPYKGTATVSPFIALATRA